MERRGNRARFWVVIALAVTLFPMGLLSLGKRLVALRPLVGVNWVQTSSGPLAMFVQDGTPAWKSGLRPGDLLVAIDGQRIASALDASQIGWTSVNDDPIELTIGRGRAEVNVQLVPDREPQSEIAVYLGVVALAFWASGLFIAIRWPNIRGGFLYSLLAMCLFTHFMFSHTGAGDRFDWLVYWLDIAAGALAPALLLHLATVLSRSVRPRGRSLVGLSYGVFAALTLSALWLVRGGALLFEAPLQSLEMRDRIEPLVLAASLILSVTLLVRAYSGSSSVLHRSQMRWVLWGLGIGLGPSVLFYFVPFALGAPELPSWAVFIAVAPTLFVPAAFTAALARYRLHDLDDLLVRGFTEATAVFTAFAIYATAAFLLREVIAEFVPLSRSATRYFGFAIAAISYASCRNWARTGVERAFYRKRYSYRVTLLDWARELSAETDLASLVHGLRERIPATLGVPDAQVLLTTRSGRFESFVEGDAEGARTVLELDGRLAERLESEPYIAVPPGAYPSMPWVRYLFPSRIKGRTRALIAVAERPEPAEPLSTEDRALLATLAAHAASAIEAGRLVLEVRKRADEIEQLHARQEKILENSAVGLVLINDRGTIQSWNRALEEIYGLSRSEAVGKRPNEIFPLHVVRRVDREAAAVDQSQGSRSFRLAMVNRRDERIVINVSISGVDPADGGGRVVAFDDVTRRIKLEEQVLQQERLASLGLLAAGVAHEINTPLTGISSYTQLLLEDTSTSQPRRELLEKIEQQTVRAAGITSSLLNLARPESTAFEDLDLSRTLQEVVQLFEPQVRGGGIRLVTEVAEDLPRVRGHKGKLQQVMLNLLINARDAIDGSGRIRISARAEEGRVVLEVEDDGRGIPEEDLPRIFDPFFSTKGSGKGTGLGLSITYGIIREHDGEIEVDSRPDDFTRFRIVLPPSASARAMA